MKRLWNTFTNWTDNQTLNVQRWIWSVVVIAVICTFLTFLFSVVFIGVWCGQHAPFLLPVYFLIIAVCIVRLLMESVSPDTD